MATSVLSKLRAQDKILTDVQNLCKAKLSPGSGNYSVDGNQHRSSFTPHHARYVREGVSHIAVLNATKAGVVTEDLFVPDTSIHVYVNQSITIKQSSENLPFQ
jgi:hypothetical protein